MNRKHFLQSFFTAGLSAFFAGRSLAATKEEYNFNTIPQYLEAGDTVGITCPAGHVNLLQIEPCLNTLRRWDLEVKLGRTVGTKWQRFAGTDEERLHDFQTMIEDDSIKAIIFGKGGYGSMRIIDKIDWSKFIKKPKWLIGYSDLTIVHLHLHTNTQIATIHGDMCSGFSQDSTDPSCLTIQQALFGEKLEYVVNSYPLNRYGHASGKLIGGNLSMLNAAAGSKSDISTKGKILFIEDVSEYKYNIDRMMMTLKRSGKLDELAGLIVGGFTAIKSHQEEVFNLEVEEIIMEKVSEFKYPVCFHFPAGHVRNNRALKFGVSYDLSVMHEQVVLSEKLHISSLKDFSTSDA